jgi:hypothetical protein
MPTTFVHGLLPPSCVAVTHRTMPKLTWKEWAKLMLAAGIIGNFPDLDLLPALVWPGLWRELHRFVGHNLIAFAAWVVLGRWLLVTFVSPKLAPRAWLLAFSLVFSHFFFDSMSFDPMKHKHAGLPLFWPLSKHEYSIPFDFFPGVTWDHSKNVISAHVFCTDYWTRVVFIEIRHSLLLLFLWSAVWGTGRIFYKLTKLTKKREPVSARTEASRISYPAERS